MATITETGNLTLYSEKVFNQSIVILEEHNLEGGRSEIKMDDDRSVAGDFCGVGFFSA